MSTHHRTKKRENSFLRTRSSSYLIKAFLEYSKLGLPDRGTDVCKVEIAMYVAVLVADDPDNGGLAKEAC